ncbi:MAG: DUF488 family protein [Fimbriimonadales bacterium]
MQIYSIGHSNHQPDKFLSLLRQHQVEAVVDVRSRPYSQRFPHFGRETLSAWLPKNGIAYHYMGDGLGGFPKDPECYTIGGHVLYDCVVQKPFFQHAIQQLLQLPYTSVALMCAEENPDECHRAKLIARHLLTRLGIDVRHIRADGSLLCESARLTQHTASLFDEFELGASQRTLYDK